VTQVNGTVVFLNELDGQQLSRVYVGEEIQTSPALHGGTLFVPAKSKVYAFDLLDALDPATGQEVRPLWECEVDGEEVIQPLLVNERAVYFSARRGQHVSIEAVLPSSGLPAWPQPLLVRTQQTLPMVLLKEHLVLITEEGEVNVIELATAKPWPPFYVDRAIKRLAAQVSPFVSDHRILVADEDGRIFEITIDQRGPKSFPLFDLKASITSLTANSDYIILGQMDGVTLLNSRGQKRWAYNSDDAGVYVPPILAGATFFALDERGFGLLFHNDSNPRARLKLFGGSVVAPPLLTRSQIIAVSYEGQVAAIDWI
jgi:hypothetical protein